MQHMIVLFFLLCESVPERSASKNLPTRCRARVPSPRIPFSHACPLPDRLRRPRLYRPRAFSRQWRFRHQRTLPLPLPLVSLPSVG
ncbi:uncharacterized protein EV422DRAFT_513408 [Fimicolochytrium jonesii]|uniref:uncharacterized protein n=1 Tax=Fimicolochytrium jonesii TaxID=1396493 RepID=UPI0022FDCEDB|nr:uncharacterized protein EV422DRAFT_513408 [Fimicolochytrium jonesii]KAI8825581.1 hypothetical protein EV422DRAFT_513408 [Fimicolochytrium jonesii]